jgi:effector-binding domain-containing protein
MLEGLRLGMPLASFGEDMIPIFAILVVFGIPIIAILTTHQRKMTELIHRNNPQTVDPMVQQQLANMEHQISDLRSMMQEHIINNDRSTLSPPPTPTVEQRLNQ